MKNIYEYKVFNLAYEYGAYIGEIRFAIATDLTEEELRATFGDEISKYEPFILITTEMGEIMTEANNNEAKHRMRSCEGYEVQLFDCFGTDNEIDESEEDEGSEELILHRKELVTAAISRLTPNQRECVSAYFFDKKSKNEIAAEKDCTPANVRTTIRRSLIKMRSFIEKMEVSA